MFNDLAVFAGAANIATVIALEPAAVLVILPDFVRLRQGRAELLQRLILLTV